MKTFRIFAAAMIGVVAMSMTACEPKEEPTKNLITLSTEELTFNFEGETQSVTIESEIAYEVTPSAEWITYIETADGIDVTIGATTEERNGEIVVKSADDTKTIAIVQNGQNLITLSTETLEFEAEGSTQSVTIESEIEYTITPSAEWITYIETADGIDVTIGETDAERNGTITIESADDSKNITVKQNKPAIHPLFGVITFRTENVWEVGEQTWSDVVMVSNARGKTDYMGGLTTGERNADFCENGTYYDLFSFEAVRLYKDDLCPDEWRVPTQQDFKDLDIALGGDGNSRYLNDPVRMLELYIGTDSQWGGELGGRMDGLSGSEDYFPGGQGWWGHYWSETQDNSMPGNAYSLALGDYGDIIVDQGYYEGNGFAVRCVK